jgi:hypothetical protein
MAANIPNDDNTTAILTTGYAGAATQTITLMAWFMVPVIGTPANYRDIVSLDPNIYMQLYNDGTSIDYGTQTTDHTGPAVIAGVWYHTCQIVVPTSTTSRQIYGYLNGQLQVNVTDTTTSTTYTSINVGNSVLSSEVYPLVGYVKDVKVWTRQLSATEVVDEMNTKYPIHWQSLLLWLPLDDSLSSDKSGNGNVITVGSAVTLVAGPFKQFARPKRVQKVF